MLEMIEWMAAALALKCAALGPYWRLRDQGQVPRVINGALVFDRADALKVRDELDALKAEMAWTTAVPEMRLQNSSGLVGTIDSDGVLRPDQATGGFRVRFHGGLVESPEPNGSGGMADVIDLRKRQAGE